MRLRFKVKEFAEAKQMTQHELALRAGLRLSAVVGVWRNTVAAPGIDTLYAIAKALNVTVDDLFTEEVEPGQWYPAPSARPVVITTI